MSETSDATQTRPTLSEQLAAARDGFIASQPPDVQLTVGAAIEKLMSSRFGSNALKAGDQVPLFSLPNAKGEKINFSDYLAKGPVVLSFYRGGWCPFCNLEFKALTDALPDIKRLGATLIGVSPELPDVARETVSKHKLPFEVLSDVGNNVANQFGLVMEVYEELRPLYLEWGLDIPSANGDDNWQLPIPATYVINLNGKVISAYVNVDYTSRMEPDAIIEVLEKQ